MFFYSLKTTKYKSSTKSGLIKEKRLIIITLKIKLLTTINFRHTNLVVTES